MAVLVILLSVCAAGLIGGLLNAFFAHEGFVLSRLERLPDGRRIWRPGFLGNMMVGAVTALVMAALYSPLGSVPIGALPSATGHPLTLGSLAGALLAGIGGARLLTNEVDRRLAHVTEERLVRLIDEWTRTEGG